ncbi:hypothetical protein EGR_10202 [Echinococcus granulosus]|uniref:Uncharacterized protein n=1 Tax=Echinococcus granulosus TaxID=6210 RepID=W6UNM9_ECHGR|nr:hypothetical protein EGR_10202 [Echinococcus granulosus]EUB54944.1 hypothetical protein EGR_10202 [Echinococcus granulosus]
MSLVVLSVGKARISPFPKAMECLRLSPLPEVDVNKRLVERFKDPLSVVQLGSRFGGLLTANLRRVKEPRSIQVRNSGLRCLPYLGCQLCESSCAQCCCLVEWLVKRGHWDPTPSSFRVAAGSVTTDVEATGVEVDMGLRSWVPFQVSSRLRCICRSYEKLFVDVAPDPAS